MKASPGVSMKFEVGSWLEENNRLHEQGAIRPLNLGGSGGMVPQRILKSGSSEMPFLAFWAPNRVPKIKETSYQQQHFSLFLQH